METFLTPEELAKSLKVSRVWVYKLVNEGRIPFFRLAGKVIRFDPKEIGEWMGKSRGEKYHRDKDNEKKGAKSEALAGGCASTGGKNNRLPDGETGAQK